MTPGSGLREGDGTVGSTGNASRCICVHRRYARATHPDDRGTRLSADPSSVRGRSATLRTSRVNAWSMWERSIRAMTGTRPGTDCAAHPTACCSPSRRSTFGNVGSAGSCPPTLGSRRWPARSGMPRRPSWNSLAPRRTRRTRSPLSGSPAGLPDDRRKSPPPEESGRDPRGMASRRTTTGSGRDASPPEDGATHRGVRGPAGSVCQGPEGLSGVAADRPARSGRRDDAGPSTLALPLKGVQSRSSLVSDLRPASSLTHSPTVRPRMAIGRMTYRARAPCGRPGLSRRSGTPTTLKPPST